VLTVGAANDPCLFEKNRHAHPVSQALPSALAYFGPLPDAGAMSRTLTALLIGLVGFTVYVGLALFLGDFVLRLHWTIQFLYFALVGVIWAWPARWLIYWSARR